MKRNLIFVTSLILSAGFPLSAFAISYQPGQTLNPSCPPTDATCVVVPNTTSSSFTATSTTATSTFAGGVSIGSLNGILKAVAGAITTALVNLSSDVTGILPVANGGTGWNALASGFIPFGNGASALATSSSLYWDNTDGRLGVGTTSPSAILTLDSASPNGTIMRVSNGSPGGHIYDWLSTGSANTGGAGRLDLYDFTMGAPRLSIAANGNVGIGTTSPFANLAVAGSAFLSGNLNVGDATTTRSNLGLAYATSGGITSAQSTQQVVAWGDSETAGAGTVTPYTNTVSSILGYTVVNKGIGGQTSLQIAVREGSVPTSVTVSGAQIPATGSVVVAFTTGYEPITSQGPYDGITGTISGVHGVVTYSNGTYTFTPTNATTTVSVSGVVPFTVDASDEYLNDIQVIWSGENDYQTSVTQVESDIAAMVSHIGSNPNYLILSVLNGSACPSGAGCYTSLLTLNNYLATTYPGHYFDIREYLIQHGLSDAGITPSVQDLTDIGNDVVPTDLRSDSIHFDGAGYQVVGQQVAKFIQTNFVQSATTSIISSNNISALLASPNITGTLTDDNLQMMFNATRLGFGGTLYFGNGGKALAHTTGNEGYWDTGIGFNSLLSNTTGNYNTAVGANSLEFLASSTNDTAIGTNALENSLASYNTAIGSWALQANTTGSFNTAVGYDTLLNTTSGASNIALGYWAMNKNITGSYNIAIGNSALYNSTSTNGNVAIGYNALTSATSTLNETAIGFEALYSDSSGQPGNNWYGNNTAVGNMSLYSNTYGTANTAVGALSLQLNTTGSDNAAIGDGALGVNTTGSRNVAIGDLYTLSSNNAGSYNVAIGSAALKSNTTGQFNVAIGAGDNSGNGPLDANTTGQYNIVLGQRALNNNSTGSYNIALGGFALGINTAATNTVAIGYRAAFGGTGNGVSYWNSRRNSGRLSGGPNVPNRLRLQYLVRL